MVRSVLVLQIFLIAVVAINIGKRISRAIFEIPHDSNCFTQGLQIHNNIIYESCGLYGKSSIRKVDYQTGKVLMQRKLDREFFAEGIVVHNNTLFMLTWKNKKLFLFNAEDLSPIGSKYFTSHTGEGWGLTTDGDHLIVSDGSEVITFFNFPNRNNADPNEQLQKVRQISVYDPHNQRPIKQINELEYVNGDLFCNIWYKDVILQVDTSNGHIIERYDMSNVYPTPQRDPKSDCLNGIAYDRKRGHFLVTGKLWPKYFGVNFTSVRSLPHNGDL